MPDRGAVDVSGGGRAGQRHRAQPVRADDEAAEQHLDGRGALVVVGDEAVGQPQRRPVGSTRARHPDGRVPRTAEVLHDRERTHLPDLQPPLRGAGGPVHLARFRRSVGGGVPSHELHLRARGQQRGGSRSGSHSTASVRPISCQPPGELRG